MSRAKNRHRQLSLSALLFCGAALSGCALGDSTATGADDGLSLLAGPSESPKSLAALGFETAQLTAHKTPLFLSGIMNAAVVDGSSAAQLMLSQLAPAYRLSAETRFEVTAERSDEAGNRYFRLRQVHAGIPVVDGEVTMQADRSGAVLAVIGELKSDLRIEIPASAKSIAVGREAIRRALASSAKLGTLHFHGDPSLALVSPDAQPDATVRLAYRALVDSFGYADPPWPTSLEWYRAVKRVTPDSLNYLLEDGIKYITLYDNQVVEAKGRMNTDSTWTVTMKLTAAKEHADSLGKGTSVLMDDWMDIAVERWPTYGKGKELNDVPLVQQRVKLHTGENMFTFTVAGKPSAVAVDPDHLFFDRHPEDNRMKVELEGKK